MSILQKRAQAALIPLHKETDGIFRFNVIKVTNNILMMWQIFEQGDLIAESLNLWSCRRCQHEFFHTASPSIHIACIDGTSTGGTSTTDNASQLDEVTMDTKSCRLAARITTINRSSFLFGLFQAVEVLLRDCNLLGECVLLALHGGQHFLEVFGFTEELFHLLIFPLIDRERRLFALTKNELSALYGTRDSLTRLILSAQIIQIDTTPEGLIRLGTQLCPEVLKVHSQLLVQSQSDAVPSGHEMLKMRLLCLPTGIEPRITGGDFLRPLPAEQRKHLL
mmetsp:Transcript_39759/g.100188  ORF Transcript_39759/g.100188 Transcript_39759/m.100188 type:complete len:279 (-) Transcript_39759:1385-2221(-)